MDVVYDQQDFDNISFVQLLEEDGFDIFNIGGTYNNNFTSGLVRQYKNNQAQLIGQTESILTCDPNTFYRTLLDVEKQFKYKLFG